MSLIVTQVQTLTTTGTEYQMFVQCLCKIFVKIYSLSNNVSHKIIFCMFYFQSLIILNSILSARKMSVNEISWKGQRNESI